MAKFRTIAVKKELCVEYFLDNDDNPGYGFWCEDAKEAATHIQQEFRFMGKRLSVRVNGFLFTNNPPAPILQHILDNTYKP